MDNVAWVSNAAIWNHEVVEHLDGVCLTSQRDNPLPKSADANFDLPSRGRLDRGDAGSFSTVEDRKGQSRPAPVGANLKAKTASGLRGRA
jgi:hypothetical protein